MKKLPQAAPGEQVPIGESTPALLRLYRWLLRLYPSRFRSEFGEEMQEVFDEVLDDTQRVGGKARLLALWRELAGLPAGALGVQLDGDSDETEPGSQGRLESLAGGELIIALGAFCLPALLAFSHVDSATQASAGIAVVMFVITAFAVGLSQGFPRWSLPYLGLVISLTSYVYLFSWITDQTVIPASLNLGPLPLDASLGVLVEIYWAGILWLGLFLITLLFVGALSLLRSFRPFLQRIQQDWTLVSFIFYGETALALGMLYSSHGGEQPYTITSMLMLAAGAWLYLRTPLRKRRALALLCSLTLALWVAGMGQESLTIGGRSSELWLAWAWMAAALLAPAWLRRFLPQKTPAR